jgi:hypothetical protein
MKVNQSYSNGGDMNTAKIDGFSRYTVYDGGMVKRDGGWPLSPYYDTGRRGRYARIKLTDDSGRRTAWRLNRLVYTAFNGPIPPGFEIDHLDGDKSNNALSNLMMVTRRQNEILKKQRDSKAYLFN